MTNRTNELPPVTLHCLGCGMVVDWYDGDEVPRDSETCSHEFENCPAPCGACDSVPCCCKAPAEADADDWSPSVPCPLCGVYASVGGEPCGVCRTMDVA